MSEHRLNLADLKALSPKDLVAMAEELEIENASTMRKGEIMFQILRERADEGYEIFGDGVLEVLQDGFGFLRSADSSYLAGPDDIYVSPSQIRRFNLRTGDTISGQVRPPKEGERYFALIKVEAVNFEAPEQAREKIFFDNLTPLYPDSMLNLEHQPKDMTTRLINLLCDTALVYGYAEQRDTIDAELINEVARDKQSGGLFPSRAPETPAANPEPRSPFTGRTAGARKPPDKSRTAATTRPAGKAGQLRLAVAADSELLRIYLARLLNKFDIRVVATLPLSSQALNELDPDSIDVLLVELDDRIDRLD